MRDLFNNIKWRNHISGLLLMAGSFLLLAASTYNYWQQDNKLQLAKLNFSAQQELNFDAQNSEDILVDELENYWALRDKGYIGDARRLQWVETVRQLASEYRIPDIQFTLENSQLLTEDDGAFWSPNVSMRMTTMKIVMRMAHEGDLYQFMNGMQNTAKGLFDVNYCDLKWSLAESDEESLTRLNGVCELHWITLVDTTKNWGQRNE